MRQRRVEPVALAMFIFTAPSVSGQNDAPPALAVSCLGYLMRIKLSRAGTPAVEVMRNCRSEAVARKVNVRCRPRAASLEVILSTVIDDTTLPNDGPSDICAVQFCVAPAAVKSHVTVVRFVPVMPGSEAV